MTSQMTGSDELNGLPKSVREIAEVIGLNATEHLLYRLPTTRSVRQHKKAIVICYVPKRLLPDHPYVGIIGWDAAKKLSRAFGGEILYPANLPKIIHTRARNGAMLQMFEKEGATVAELAKLFCLTERAIRFIVRGKTARGKVSLTGG